MGLFAWSHAFNLLTRAFSLLTRGFELVTRGFELVTHRFELATHEFELVTRGFELLTRKLCFTFPPWSERWAYATKFRILIFPKGKVLKKSQWIYIRVSGGLIIKDLSFECAVRRFHFYVPWKHQKIKGLLKFSHFCWDNTSLYHEVVS